MMLESEIIYQITNTMEAETGQTKISQNHTFFIKSHNLQNVF